MSHGKATVEIGFYINSDVLIEHLYDSSVFAQRQVHDGICHAVGVLKVEINKSLIKSAHMSHSSCQDVLQRKKNKKLKWEQKKAEKRLTISKIKKLKIKKTKLIDIVKQEMQEIDIELKSLS